MRTTDVAPAAPQHATPASAADFRQIGLAVAFPEMRVTVVGFIVIVIIVIVIEFVETPTVFVIGVEIVQPVDRLIVIVVVIVIFSERLFLSAQSLQS
jgi:hypothetical protein